MINRFNFFSKFITNELFHSLFFVFLFNLVFNLGLYCLCDPNSAVAIGLSSSIIFAVFCYWKTQQIQNNKADDQINIMLETINEAVDTFIDLKRIRNRTDGNFYVNVVVEDQEGNILYQKHTTQKL